MSTTFPCVTQILILGQIFDLHRLIRWKVYFIVYPMALIKIRKHDVQGYERREFHNYSLEDKQPTSGLKVIQFFCGYDKFDIHFISKLGHTTQL